MELFIRIRDKVHPTDPEKNRRLCKRGDVVVICPDGFPWSEYARTSPDHRIVALPGVNVGDIPALDALQHPAVDGEGRTVGRRARRLNLESLPAAIRDRFRMDRTREEKITVAPAVVAAIVDDRRY